MKKHYLLLILFCSISQVFAQRNTPWQLLDNDKEINSERIRESAYSDNQKLLQFNAVQFKQLLSNVNDRASGLPGVEISLPNIDGKLERFMVWESSNFEPQLQAQFPEIRAFVGKGITDPSATLNFSFSPSGIQTMVFRADTGSEFIEPYTKDRSVYVVFDSKTRIAGQLPFVCSQEDIDLANNLQRNGNVTFANNQVYKTMRLALSCTGGYGTDHGGTRRLARGARQRGCHSLYEPAVGFPVRRQPRHER